MTDDVVMSMKVAIQTGCSRIARWVSRFLTQRQRRKITVFHKANIMKRTDGRFFAVPGKSTSTTIPISTTRK